MKEDFKGTYQRLKFLNKFYLYSELTKQFADNNFGNAAANGVSKEKAMEQFCRPLDKYELEVMSIFNCNKDWPICLYDFTYKTKIPEYIALRTSSGPIAFMDNYMDNPNQNEM